VVLFAGALTYLGGFVNAGGRTATPALVLLTISMSPWMAPVGAVTKDFGDLVGDWAQARRSALGVIGERRVRWFVAAIAPLIPIGFLATARMIAPLMIVPAATVVTGGVAVAMLTISLPTSGSRSRLRMPYRTFMARSS
jgi:4-hydroxybenzoate polyprenyltransferase/chlorophyll synthase